MTKKERYCKRRARETREHTERDLERAREPSRRERGLERERKRDLLQELFMSNSPVCVD